MRSGISELTIIDFGVRVKNDRKIAEWVIGLSRNQRSYNPEMGGRNAPKYAQALPRTPRVVRTLSRFHLKHSNYFKAVKHHQAVLVAANMSYLRIAHTNAYLSYFMKIQAMQQKMHTNLPQIPQMKLNMMQIVYPTLL